MLSFEHFGHEHPLIFNKEKNIEEEINRDHFCHICSLSILLSSFYSCTVTDCKYFLHEPCALLPQQISNPWYSGLDLDLVKHEGTCDCTRCGQECKNLHYCDRHRFPNDYDSLHPMCAAPVEIKSKHKSHPRHPLVAVCKESSARCDACGRKQNGYFFTCLPCNFWIHVDCALLPKFVKCTKHSHPLILTYSIEREHITHCMICRQRMKYVSEAYLCGDCRKYAHLSCVAENMEEFGTEAKVEIIDLPFDDLDALWSWTMQNLQKMKLDEGNSTYDYNQLHDHGLILHNDDDHGIGRKNSSSVEPYISQELVCCNVCIQPIYPPFYACPRSQSDECHFHLHQQCSELPFRVKNPIVSPYAQELRTWSTTERSLCSLFRCYLCKLPSNGLSYYSGSGITDIACLSAPKFIKHESHRQHVLYQFDFRHRYRTLNCCPDEGLWNAYYCVDCYFTIHIHCALLPKRVEHKFDVHPLNLITTSIIKDDTTNSSDNLCEFCEEDIDTRFWHYGCEECNNLFHIKCIPSVGYLSRVKFGNSITVPCHPHRVTFVRMLGYGSQTCAYCKEIIQGFVDDMAFHCSECDFWMHFGCAEDCSGT